MVFHQPNGKFPLRAGKALNFTREQIATGLLTPRIGNTYSGAVPLGLSAILDVAQPGQRILAVAYGSGAGSDGFDITVTDEISHLRKVAPKGEQLIQRMETLNYATHAKYRGKFLLGVAE